MMKEIKLKGRKLKLGKPLIMGILNVTPDSFSDGNRFRRPGKALEQAGRMISEGADIIDIGGESTRPYARPVSAGEELKRVLPVIAGLRKMSGIPVSIDTYKAEVARRALEEGADIINDISALRMDCRMAETAARSGAPVVLMHMQGTPGNMQERPRYRDIVADISVFLRSRAKEAIKKGIEPGKIIVDPGIGFGKTLSHNMRLLNSLEEFRKLGFPLLCGPSRKSFIGKVLGVDVESRLEGTAAAVAISVWNSADIIRVHDVLQMKRVALMAYTIKNAKLKIKNCR